MAGELTTKEVDMETALQILTGQGGSKGEYSSAQGADENFERKFTLTIDPNLGGRIVSLLMEEDTPGIK